MHIILQKLIKSINRLKYLFVLLVLFLHSGCFVTTHSFNHGKLLDPGERMITTGFGWKYSARFLKRYNDTYYESSIDTAFEWGYFDSTRFGWFNFALNYRVGVLRKYPFGKGLETGFHLETAFRGDQYLYYNDESKEYDKSTFLEPISPPLLEIDTRFGLPDRTLKKGIFHHNVNWGWVIGQWVDNGWFLGYAAGIELEPAIVYCSLRYLITATDKFNSTFEDDFFKKHERTHGVRLQCGTSLKLPFNESFLPEYITPEFSLMLPNFNKVQPVGFSFSIGIRWKPGF